MVNIKKTHQNQFGYKSKTHTLFAFKETIVKYIGEKKWCIAVKLDTVKAFDLLWREAQNKKCEFKNEIKIIYYDTLESQVLNDSIFSPIFKLKRGLKQRVLSGNLFNFYINELIELCCSTNLGANCMEIILCILAFCDDLCLLSDSTKDLKILLKMCEGFANK